MFLNDLNDLDAYMKHVQRFDLLTREEEYELAVRAREEGDKSAIERLINCNLRLVIKIAHQYSSKRNGIQDLVQEGNIGLITAVNKFDPYRNVKLHVYATWWIRQAVNTYVLNNKLIRLPVRKEMLLRRISRYIDEYTLNNGFPPGLGDISERCMIPMPQLLDIWAIHDPVSSLDKSSLETKDIFDLVGNNRYNPAFKVRRLILQNHLKHVLSTLTERENYVVRRRFALGCPEPETFRIIAAKLCITSEAVRLIELKALNKLREHRKELAPLLEELQELSNDVYNSVYKN